MKRASLLVGDPPHRPQSASVASWYTPGLSDGLGDRLLMFDNTTTSSLELLRFKPEFGEQPGFEAALRRRVDELAGFVHPSIAKVRKVEWLRDGEGLALVSNHMAGRRLSEVIDKAVGPSFALELIRQLTPILANLERQGPEIAHGLLTPERIVVMPEGRLVLTEHVVGPALESLRLSASQLRSRLGIVLPGTDRPARLNGRTDVIQLAFMALAMLLGRRIPATEYPEGGIKLLDELVQSSGYNTSAAARLRHWLERALQLGGRTFGSAQEAHAALQELPEENELLMAPPPRNVHAFHPPAEPAKAYAPEFPAEESIRDSGRIEAEESSSSAMALSSQRAIEEWRALRSAHQEATNTSRGRRRWLIPALGVLALVEAAAIVALVLRAQGLPPVTTTGKPTEPLNTIATASTGPGGVSTAPPATAPASLPDDSAAAANVPGTQRGPAASNRTQGRLDVSADTPGARVTIDGTPRGQAPLTIDLEPGPHNVVISDGRATVSRTVTLAAGSSSTVMAAMGSASAAAGWLAVVSPLELQILEGGTLIGTTSAARVMLPAGRHDLVLAASALGFQTSISAEIRAGRTSSATVTIPNGSLSLNALPWANVWVDGRAVGTTPVANLEVPLGPHDVIWRHPQLGERRQTTVVTAKAPVRLVMDLSK